MHIVMKVTVDDGARVLDVGETVETSDEVAADFIARGYAEPETVETRKASSAAKKAASQ